MADLKDPALIQVLSSFPQFIAQAVCSHGVLCTFSVPGKKFEIKRGPAMAVGCGTCVDTMRDEVVKKGKWEPYNQK